MNEREALEKIKEIAQEWDLYTILDIATQALAPQECDVDSKYLKEILEELNCDAKWAVQNIKSLRKQLHSQEKTFRRSSEARIEQSSTPKFTVEEVREKLSILIENDYLDDLMSEFEKAVE